MKRWMQKEEADITILEVGYLGGFVKYDLHTKDGNVDVVRSYYGSTKTEKYRKKYNWELSSRVLELYRRRISDVFWCLVFRRIIYSYIKWSRGAYCITSAAIG